MVLWLIVFDIAIGVLFARQADPTVRPGVLPQYFDYGRSIAGKVRFMVGETDQTTASVCIAGWPDDGVDRPTEAASKDGTLVAVYGQSFAQRASQTWARQNPKLTLRIIAGPGAPLSYAYDRYLQDRHNHHAKIVVVGVLASAIPHLDTITAMTWNFERPPTYMYPRYQIRNNQLTQFEPPIRTLAQFREVLKAPLQWDDLLQKIQEHDGFYDSFVFHDNLVDRSVIGRLIRRAWGQRQQHRVNARYHTAQGYRPETGVIQTAQALLTEFAQAIRNDDRTPIILLLNDRGFDDHLYQEVAPLLRQKGIPFVSTHAYAPAKVLSNFLPDGHFIPSVDEITAQKMQAIYEASQAQTAYATVTSYEHDTGHDHSVFRGTDADLSHRQFGAYEPDDPSVP